MVSSASPSADISHVYVPQVSTSRWGGILRAAIMMGLAARMLGSKRQTYEVKLVAYEEATDAKTLPQLHGRGVGKSLNMPKGRARKIIPLFIDPFKIVKAAPASSTYTLELPHDLAS